MFMEASRDTSRWRGVGVVLRGWQAMNCEAIGAGADFRFSIPGKVIEGTGRVQRPRASAFAHFGTSAKPKVQCGGERVPGAACNFHLNGTVFPHDFRARLPSPGNFNLRSSGAELKSVNCSAGGFIRQPLAGLNLDDPQWLKCRGSGGNQFEA